MGQKFVNGVWEVWDDDDVEERDPDDFEKVYNQKIKIYSDSDFFTRKTITCNKEIFRETPKRLTVSQILARQRKARENKENGVVNLSKNFEHFNRTMEALDDLIMMNDFDYFLTVTFDPKEVDSKNAEVVMKKLNTWLENRVKRNNLKFVLIPEYHKKGGIHCHALISGDLTYVESGTITWEGKKGKPIKIKTAKKLGVPEELWHTVYNVKEWKYGFSTAIKLYGDKARAKNYILKYIQKGNDKIFGRYYYSSRNLIRKPLILYGYEIFDEVDAEPVEIKGTDIKLKYQSTEDWIVKK